MTAIGCGGPAGFGDSPTTANVEERRAARLAIYRRIFGEPRQEIRGNESDDPRVDLYVFGPGHAGREFYTIVTSGMSDRAMNVPADLGRDARRTELAIYVDQPGKSYFELLRVLARLPFVHDAWVGHGHTIPNGDPPVPLFQGSPLVAMLLLKSNVAPERDMFHVVEVEGDPLNMLMLLPITRGELDVKLERGVDALLDVFNAGQLSFVVDPGRASLV